MPITWEGTYIKPGAESGAQARQGYDPLTGALYRDLLSGDSESGWNWARDNSYSGYMPWMLNGAGQLDPIAQKFIAAGYDIPQSDWAKVWHTTSGNGNVGNWVVSPDFLTADPAWANYAQRDALGNYVNDPSTGGVLLDPRINPSKIATDLRNQRYVGGVDALTGFLDAGGGVLAAMALAGLGAATGFGGALGAADAAPAAGWVSGYDLPMGSDLLGSAGTAGGTFAGGEGFGSAPGGVTGTFTDSIAPNPLNSFNAPTTSGANMFGTWYSDPTSVFDLSGTTDPINWYSNYANPITTDFLGNPMPGYTVNLANSGSQFVPVDSSFFGGNNPIGNYIKSLMSPQGGLPSSITGGQPGGQQSTMDRLLGLAGGAAANWGALNYANNLTQPNIGAYTELYNKAGDTSGILGQYDINTGIGRNNLTTSLESRGVLGSSFGDQALTNYNTQRDIGRGALGYQGIGTQLNALSGGNTMQIAQNKIKTDLLGRALGGVGNSITGGQPSSFSDLSALLKLIPGY